jgi:hypothetical protein
MNYNNIKLRIKKSDLKIFYRTNIIGLDIIKSTSFLPDKTEMRQRLLYIKYDIFCQVSCPNCNKPSNINRRSKIFKISYCSKKCNFSHNLEKNKEKRNKALIKIDVESGLTGFQLLSKKASETMSIKNPDTGLTTFQSSAKKALITIRQIDPITGKSKIHLARKKSAATRAKVDSKTGLTGHEKSALKAQQTMNVIDPLSGMTKTEISTKNRNITMSKIDVNMGLTLYQIAGLKISNTHNEKSYTKLNDIVKTKFQILTTKEEYIKSKICTVQYKCLKCNSIRESSERYIRCIICHPYNISKGESEVLKYCQTLKLNIISNSRKIINPLELDIYLPDNNLAIEYNGLYYHSSNSIDTERENYHLYKTQKCENKDIQLFHIFENEWKDLSKREIWKSTIKQYCLNDGYSKDPKILKIDNYTKKIFLIKNHLLGDCESHLNFGIYSNQILISVMVFNKINSTWKLERFCNIEGNIKFNFNKLLKNFKLIHSGPIVSIINRRYDLKSLYIDFGFKIEYGTPNYFYWKNKIILYEKDIKNHLNPEFFYKNGYRKTYDCGNIICHLA